MIRWIKTNLIWTEGRKVLISAFALTVFACLLYKPLAIGGLIFILWSFYFFRNPRRICPAAQSDDTILVCPADGRVIDIQYNQKNSFEGYAYKVSIFLSAFDVHVNWASISGNVIQICYKPGAFMLAFLPKSSLLNEHNDIIIKDENGRRILVRQIAGLIARRIRCWIKEGENLTIGQKYGMILFGSRVDIFLPDSVVVEITKGCTVYGGQTILGRWICY